MEKESKNNPIHRNWCNIFQIEENNRSELLARLARVFELPQLAEDAVRKHEDELDPQIYLKWVPNVQKAFSFMNLDANWDSITAHLRSPAMESLVFCNDRLSKLSPENEINDETLSNLRDQVKVVIDSISDCVSLPQHFIDFMFERLYAVEAAIIDYSYLGAHPLKTVFESTVGAVSLKPETFQQTKDDPQGEKFWDIMGKVAVITQIASNGQILIEKGVG